MHTALIHQRRPCLVLHRHFSISGCNQIVRPCCSAIASTTPLPTSCSTNAAILPNLSLPTKNVSERLTLPQNLDRLNASLWGRSHTHSQLSYHGSENQDIWAIAPTTLFGTLNTHRYRSSTRCNTRKKNVSKRITLGINFDMPDAEIWGRSHPTTNTQTTQFSASQ
jgi:hypothetical protein